MKKDFRKFKKNGGAAMLISVVFFLFISLAIIAGLVSPTVREFKNASVNLNSKKSYFLSESGSEDAAYRIINNMTIGSSETITLDSNSATTVITSPSGGVKQIISLGDVSSYQRSTNITLSNGVGVSFNYGVQIGAGGLEMGNNSTVVGNVYSNGSITGSNGATVTGDAFAVGTISDVSVGGQTQTGVTSEDFPIPDDQINSWEAEAEAGGTVSSQIYSGVNNSLGPKKINGNLTLDNNAVLTVTGTLWVTGEIKLSNGSIMQLASGYGILSGVVVAGIEGSSGAGYIEVDNNSQANGSGTAGSYLMLLSQRNDTSSTAIKISNNGASVILYTGTGVVEIDNNAQLKEVTAYKLKLKNGSDVTYESGLASVYFSSGPSSGYSINGWKEIE